MGVEEHAHTLIYSHNHTKMRARACKLNNLTIVACAVTLWHASFCLERRYWCRLSAYAVISSDYLYIDTRTRTCARTYTLMHSRKPDGLIFLVNKRTDRDRPSDILRHQVRHFPHSFTRLIGASNACLTFFLLSFSNHPQLIGIRGKEGGVLLESQMRLAIP